MAHLMANLPTPLLRQAPFADRYNFGFFLNSRELIGEAVEVGTHRGDFAYRFLHCWMGEKLYCVDHYPQDYDPDDPAGKGDRREDWATAKALLAIHGRRVEFVNVASPNAALRFSDRQLSFVYVDACHRYEAVLADLRVWWPKVRGGGVLAGHDFLEIGSKWGEEVQPAVLDFAAAKRLDVHLVVEPSLAAWSYYFLKE